MLSCAYNSKTWIFPIKVTKMGSIAELPEHFTIDVHTHAIPNIWKEELIKAGYEAQGSQPIIDGFLTPPWDIEMYMKNRNDFGYDYSIMSIGTPGVNFLKGEAATSVARTINNEMAGYIEKYPTRLGAMALLPFPSLEGCLTEIKVCQSSYSLHVTCFRLTILISSTVLMS